MSWTFLPIVSLTAQILVSAWWLMFHNKCTRLTHTWETWFLEKGKSPCSCSCWPNSSSLRSYTLLDLWGHGGTPSPFQMLIFLRSDFLLLSFNLMCPTSTNFMSIFFFGTEAFGSATLGYPFSSFHFTKYILLGIYKHGERDLHLHQDSFTWHPSDKAAPQGLGTDRQKSLMLP